MTDTAETNTSQNKSRLRSFLFDSKEKYSDELKTNFLLFENMFVESYSSSYSIDEKGSYTGLPHSRNVENAINNCFLLQPDTRLTAAEAYILLASIYLHDIGKTKDGKEIDIEGTDIKKIFLEKEWLKKSEDALKKNENDHQYKSALKILLNPALYHIFDKGLADSIARICLLHNYENRNIAESNNWLNDMYLDKYGRIRIAWLGALICLGDELDSSYHRHAENDNGKLKNSLRGNISGCEVDITGRILLIHGTSDLESFFNVKNEDVMSWLYKDIVKKEEMIKTWVKEYKQMDIELRSCAVVFNNTLITVNGTGKSEEKDITKADPFILTIEPNITPLKIDRIIEGIFGLRFGVFGKNTFSWEILASESGIESIDELKKIFHRISSISRIPLEKKTYIDIPFLANSDDPGPGLCTLISFDELDGEWGIQLKVKDKKSSGEEKKPDNNQITSIKKELCFRFNEIIKKLKEKYDPSNGDSSEGGSSKGGSGTKGKHHRTVENGTKDLYYKTENSELNYLLDEIMCYQQLSKNEDCFDGRGIYFPKYQKDEQSERRMGINMVISGPPGIGKTTLAIQLISGLSKLFCSNEQGEHCDKSKRNYEKKVVSYISIEPPFNKVESIIKSIDKDGKNISIKNLQTDLGEANYNNYNSIMGWSYRDIYNDLTKEDDKKTILLLQKLSPRFNSQVTNDKKDFVFWKRFKQLCRLVENASWHGENWDIYSNQENNLLLAFVIDSLNAFGQETLVREQIYQLFKLVSWSGLLGIFLYEESDVQQQQGNPFLDEVAFLSDIFIRLSWSKGIYRYKQIEILKSRYQKHVLGPHPYKVNEKNLAIFPDLHTIMSREERHSIKKGNNKNSDNKEEFGIKIKKDKAKEETDFTFAKDSFILLKGERNTHKLAMSMLYAFSGITNEPNEPDKPDKEDVLIINFGPEINVKNLQKNIKIENQLNLNENTNNSDKKVIFEEISNKTHDKFKYNIYNDKDKEDHGNLYILSFNTGFLMPEECISVILQVIEQITSIQRVIFFSTYHLPLRFPLLAGENKFIPYFVRIMKLRGKSLLLVALEEKEIKDPDNIKLLSGMESTADYIISATKKPKSNQIDLSINKIIERDYSKYTAEINFENE